MIKVIKIGLKGFWDGFWQPLDAKQTAQRHEGLSASDGAHIRREARIEAASTQASVRGRASR